MAIPSVERPPAIKAPWLDVWRCALRVMKEQGTWAPELRPLLDEYVFALRGAHDARQGFGWLAVLEQYAEDAEDLPPIAWSVLGKIAAGLPNQWDRHTKRAQALADQLALTPRGRKAINLKGSEGDVDSTDPFAGLDELAPGRERRAKAG